MIRRFREEGLIRHGTQLLFATGQATKTDILEALRLGALDFIEKPLQPQNLIASIEYALQLSAASRESAPLSAFDGFRDDTEPLLATLDRIEKLDICRREALEEISDSIAWQILAAAYRGMHQGRLLSLRATSMMLGQPYISCVRMVRKLGKKGLVRTIPDRHDRRRTFLAISDTGRIKMEELLRRAQRMAPLA